MEQTKYLLDESQIPRRWYNVVADMPNPPQPVLHPGTGEPVGPDDLAPLFPMALIMQEVSEDAAPRIGRGFGEVLLLPVEEAVRGAVVHLDLVLDPGSSERFLKGADLVDGNALVGAAHQPEDRRLHIAGPLRRPG